MDKNNKVKGKAAVGQKKGQKKGTRERDVESYLVKRLNDSGILCLKFLPFMCAGMPDRLIILYGRVIWVELKTERGRLSPLQVYRHVCLERLGQDVRVVWTKDQADALVEELGEGKADEGDKALGLGVSQDGSGFGDSAQR